MVSRGLGKNRIMRIRVAALRKLRVYGGSWRKKRLLMRQLRLN